MAHSDARVLSLPHRIHFCGWQSTLPALQQAGWELSAEQDFQRYGVRIAMRHKDLQMRGITNSIDYNFFAAASMGGFDYARPLDFEIVYMASDLRIVTNDTMSLFRPIDAMPQFTTTERKSIDDFGIFATPLARTEEIIVEPETVMQLLEKIKAMQSPEQAAIRARNRSRERRLDEATPRTQFHAQILSIAA
jgi:hypothetical protein